MTYEERCARIWRNKIPHPARAGKAAPSRAAPPGGPKRPYILPPANAASTSWSLPRALLGGVEGAAAASRVRSAGARLRPSHLLAGDVLNLFYPLVLDRSGEPSCKACSGWKKASPSAWPSNRRGPGQRRTRFLHRARDGGRIYFGPSSASSASARASWRSATAKSWRAWSAEAPRWSRRNGSSRRFFRASAAPQMCYLDNPATLLPRVPAQRIAGARRCRSCPNHAGAKDPGAAVYLEEIVEKVKPLLRGKDEALKRHYAVRGEYLIA